MTKKFSIITVTLNNLSGLTATHTSLAQQSFQDFEWIVIDGGSDDGTQEYLQQTNAIWVSEPDNGIYDAMNKGIKRAQGYYLLFLNAGDTLAAPDVLEKTMLYTASQSTILYGDSREDGHYKPARNPKKIQYGLFTHHQAIFYKRAALEGINYDTSYKIAADYELTLRLLMQSGISPRHMPFPICIFEPGGISQQLVTQGRREQFKIRKKLGACLPLKNVLIYIAQTFTWFLRSRLPNLYWLLKSSGNSSND